MVDSRPELGGEAPADVGRVLAASAVAALFLDTGLHIHWFTPATTHYLNLDKTAIGRPLDDFDLAVRDDQLREHIAATLADLIPREQEVVTANERWYLRQVLPWRESGHERADGVIVTYADITQLKREALVTEQSREQLLLLADSLPALIAYVGADLRYQFLNASFQEWFGVQPREVRGTPITEVLGRENFERIRSHVESTLAGQRVAYETILEHRTLGARHVHITHVPLVEDDGDVPGFYALASDITETKRRQKELIERQEAYAHGHRAASMSELVATVAHQLNQPLGSITTYAAALRRESDQTRRQEIANKIAEQARVTGDIVNEMRQFIGRRSVDFDAVDINELVHRVLGLIEARILASETQVELNLAESLPTLMGSPVQLEQALINLAINALEATAACSERRVCIGTEREENAIVVSVADNGPGIPDDELGHIFKAFHTTKDNGMGMGLPICRGIVEDHGGRLWVETGEAGTTFYLRLPVNGKMHDERDN